MDDDFELPPGIGPHNDRELELLLAGTKPMAMPSIKGDHKRGQFPFMPGFVKRDKARR